LAILSPLAFFCLILPGTRKWFNLWLEHFVQWLFVGVAFIFFIYLGLALAPLPMNIAQPIIESSPSWLAWFFDYTEIVSYIILIIYFSVIFFLVRRFVPALADTAISSAKGAVAVASPYVNAWSKGTQKNFQKISKESPSIQRAGEAMSEFTAETGFAGFTNKKVPWAQGVRSVGRSITTGAVKADKQEVKESTEKLKEGGFEEIKEKWRQSHSRNDSMGMIAAMLAAEETGRMSDFLEEHSQQVKEQMDRGLIEKAKPIGENGKLRKIASVEYLQSIQDNVNLTQAEKEEKIQNFVYNDLNDKNAGALAKDAVNNPNDPNSSGNKVIHKVIDSDAPKHLKILLEGGKRNARDALRTQLGPTPADARNYLETQQAQNICKAVDDGLFTEGVDIERR